MAMGRNDQFRNYSDNDKEIVYAEDLREGFYSDLRIVRNTLKKLRNRNENLREIAKTIKDGRQPPAKLPSLVDNEYPTYEDLVRMVNSYCRKPTNPYEPYTGSQLIGLLDSYDDADLKPGLDWQFLNGFKALIVDAFNSFQNSLSEGLQVKLRAKRRN